MSGVPLRFKKLTRLIASPSLWPAAALGVVPTFEHAPIFAGREFDTVVDVGANKGQFAAFAAARWPHARLICYEPLPDPRAKLERVLARVAPGRSEIRPHALGAQASREVMHVATRQDSSSLLPLGDRQRQFFHMEEAGTIMVDVARLADESGLEELGAALLKIDVQGYEYEVLLGCGARLEAFAAIYVEASFVELYKGQKLIEDVLALLAEHGFSEGGRSVNHVSGAGPIQADLLFERRSGG